jgi:hypothetical protein
MSLRDQLQQDSKPRHFTCNLCFLLLHKAQILEFETERAARCSRAVRDSVDVHCPLGKMRQSSRIIMNPADDVPKTAIEVAELWHAHQTANVFVPFIVTHLSFLACCRNLQDGFRAPAPKDTQGAAKASVGYVLRECAVRLMRCDANVIKPWHPRIEKALRDMGAGGAADAVLASMERQAKK